jgi:hypothetical protein
LMHNDFSFFSTSECHCGEFIDDLLKSRMNSKSIGECW